MVEQLAAQLMQAKADQKPFEIQFKIFETSEKNPERKQTVNLREEICLSFN